MPSRRNLNLTSRSGNSSSGHGVTINEDGWFSHELPAGTIYATASAAGYAPAFAGPLTGTNDITGLDLVLTQGHSAAIQFVDQKGNPVKGVEVQCWYDFPASGAPDFSGGDDGRVTFPNLGEKALRLRVSAAGYQPSMRILKLEANQTLVWQLEQSEPTTGVVLFEDTGAPVAGAELHLGRIAGPDSMSYGEPTERTLLATADASGRFTLDALRSDSRYYLLISGEGGIGIVTRPVHAGEQDLRFELPRAFTVRILATNIQSEHLDHSGRLRLTRGVTFNYDDHSYGSSQSLHAEAVDGSARFEVAVLWRTPTTFTVGEQTRQFEWNELVALEQPIQFDLATSNAASATAPAPQRLIEITFNTPRDHPAPKGALLVEYIKDHGTHRAIERHTVTIDSGRAEFSVPVPTQLDLKPSGTIGYWFNLSNLKVEPDASPLRIELEAVPAGAIHGQIFGADGKPAQGLMISVFEAKKSPLIKGSLNIDIKNFSSGDDTSSRFMAAPLPFDGEYVICAHRGTTYVLSEPLRVSAQKPFHNITLAVPEGQEVSGRVLRPDGTPLTGVKVEFHFSPSAGHGFGGRTAWTDTAGRFRFEQVNPDVAGAYHVTLKEMPGFQPERVEVTPGEPIEIRLKEGLTIEGVVLDAASDWPVPGAEVYAIGTDYAANPGWVNADGLTDENGSFKFTTLRPGSYQIGSRSGRVSRMPRVNAGSDETVSLGIQLYEWSKLSPRRP
jgi:uncharacterized GH25 family protein